MARNIKNFSNYLRVGLIQTTLNKYAAWFTQDNCPMDEIESLRVWEEILKGINTLTTNGDLDVILIPELSVPRAYENKLAKLAGTCNSVIVAGLDYNEDYNNNTVINEAMTVIPKWWPENFGYGYNKVKFGKFHYAREEIKGLRDKGYNPLSNPFFYVFDAGHLGRIGIAICSDFFDIERFAVYKGQVQHIIILGYNKDITSFYFLSEAIARMAYCNVIICNTGFYGGSIVFSPYNTSYKRYIYKHEGANLFATQSVKVPVKNLIKAQYNENKNSQLPKEDRFKNPPPGFKLIENFVSFDDN